MTPERKLVCSLWPVAQDWPAGVWSLWRDELGLFGRELTLRAIRQCGLDRSERGIGSIAPTVLDVVVVARRLRREELRGAWRDELAERMAEHDAR